MASRLFMALALACLLSLHPHAPAWAHKVIASVYADGDVIAGDIGFSNGDVAADAVVDVFDPAGNKLGEAKTDAEGAFTFRPTQAVPHIFRANLGSGHVAEVRMEVEDLPGVSAVSAGDAPAGLKAGASVAPTASSVDMAEQEKLIAAIVQKQILPLRRDIAAYQEKNDLQAILGGIGYILGLFGIGFYIAARRKLAQASGATPPASAPAARG